MSEGHDSQDRMRGDRGLPDWLLLPPGPRDPELATAWATRDMDERLALGRASTRAPDGAAVAARDVDLVVALADARVATRWRLHLASAVLGWLVLMTLWGFGRAMDGGTAPGWLVGGLVAGLAAVTVAERRVRTRIGHARAWIRRPGSA